MAVDAVQKNPNSPSQVSYVKATAIGALSGYALKYLIPVTYSERDENYNDTLNAHKQDADAKKAATIEQIRKSKAKTELADTFIRLHDSNRLTEDNIKELKTPLKDDLMDLLRKLDESWSENFKTGKKNLDAVTKSIRPTHIFIATGLVIGFLSALGTNIIRRIDYYNAQYKEDSE